MVTTFSLAKLRACAIVFIIGLILQSEAQFSKKNKCLNPPRTAKKVEDNIKHCQDEVKNKLVREAYQILKDEVREEFVEETEHEDDFVFSEKSDRLWSPNRRNFNHIYSPTLVPYQDKRIAGCLLHCVYEKNNAIDQMGWPTLDGLVDFYSEGVSEHGFFMATLRAVNSCLNVVTVKYRVNRRKSPENGESCDLAFDVFDCISDQITGYCLDHFRQA